MSTPMPNLRSTWRLAAFGAAALSLVLGCAEQKTKPVAEKAEPSNEPSPAMSAYEQLLMPTEAKILEWTKPVSLSADGAADAIEAIVELTDGMGDPTKVVGTFHFELQSRRAADRMGERVAFWPIEVATAAATQMYRDPLSRYYHFPLKLEKPPLAPGRYVLSLTLHLPGGKRLFHEYEFEYAGGAAPPPSVF